MSADTPDTATVERDAFLQAMRAVANSVTVVTTQSEGESLGATVSAFSSVSADPPTVLVCLHGESRIAEAVAENGSFCVNILPVNHQHVSDRFAGRHDNEIEDRFEGIALADTDLGAPVIADSTAFGCTIHEIVDSGTHRIIIGRVQQVRAGLAEPLMYFDGGYHSLAVHADSANLRRVS